MFLFRLASLHKCGQFHETKPSASTKSPAKACPSSDIHVTEEMFSQSQQQSLQLSLHEQCGRIFTPAFTFHIFLANVAVYWLAHYHCWSKLANSNSICVQFSLINCYCKAGDSKIFILSINRILSMFEISTFYDHLFLILQFRNFVTGSDEPVWGHVTGVSASSSLLLLRKSLSVQFSPLRN